MRSVLIFSLIKCLSSSRVGGELIKCIIRSCLAEHCVQVCDDAFSVFSSFLLPFSIEADAIEETTFAFFVLHSPVFASYVKPFGISFVSFFILGKTACQNLHASDTHFPYLVLGAFHCSHLVFLLSIYNLFPFM